MVILIMKKVKEEKKRKKKRKERKKMKTPTMKKTTIIIIVKRSNARADQVARMANLLARRFHTLKDRDLAYSAKGKILAKVRRF